LSGTNLDVGDARRVSDMDVTNQTASLLLQLYLHSSSVQKGNFGAGIPA
jgi:hypothetical protein